MNHQVGEDGRYPVVRTQYTEERTLSRSKSPLQAFPAHQCRINDARRAKDE